MFVIFGGHAGEMATNNTSSFFEIIMRVYAIKCKMLECLYSNEELGLYVLWNRICSVLYRLVQAD